MARRPLPAADSAAAGPHRGAPDQPATWGPLTAAYVRLVLDYNAPQNRFYAVDNTETRTAGYACWAWAREPA